MRYALEYRPASIGAVPPGYSAVEPSDLPEARHGVVVYDEPLPLELAKAYELRPIADQAMLEQIIQNIADAVRYPDDMLELWEEGRQNLVGSMLGNRFERLYPDQPIVGDWVSISACVIERLRAQSSEESNARF